MLVVVTALAALTLIAPTSGLAQAADNQFGIFFDTEATQVNIDPAGPFFAYLFLLQPVDLVGDPATEINAFEISLRVDNATNLFKLADSVIPPNAIIVGDRSDITAGLDYIVGLAAPYPVTGGKVHLMTFQFLKQDAVPVFLYLQDTRSGVLQYQVPTANPDVSILVPAFPASSDQGTPVASFFGAVVPVESQTWGQLKSLYR